MLGPESVFCVELEHESANPNYSSVSRKRRPITGKETVRLNILIGEQSKSAPATTQSSDSKTRARVVKEECLNAPDILGNRF